MGYALRRMWLPQRVASLLWNQWQVCRGMRGNFAMESVASFAWNQWQLSYGTGGNFRAEYASLSVGTFLNRSLPSIGRGLNRSVLATIRPTTITWSTKCSGVGILTREALSNTAVSIVVKGNIAWP